MRRIISLVTVAVVMAATMVVLAAPAFASHNMEHITGEPYCPKPAIEHAQGGPCEPPPIVGV